MTPTPLYYDKPIARPFEIWSEGYSATGQSATATRLGTVFAKDFDTAVKLLAQRLGFSEHLFRNDTTGQWTYWGCKLFDNESAARIAFG
jgi:hypothetical protein